MITRKIQQLKRKNDYLHVYIPSEEIRKKIMEAAPLSY